MDFKKVLNSVPQEVELYDSTFTVTEEMVDDEFENAEILLSEVEEKNDQGTKCVNVMVTLRNGFRFNKMSCASSSDNYSREIGKDICMRKIRSEVWDYLAFYLAQRKYELTKNN